MGAQIQFVAQDGKYSDKDLQALALDLERFYKGREVMNTKQAAAFLGICKSKLYRLPSVPSHRIEGLETKLYLRSELIEFIKRS